MLFNSKLRCLLYTGMLLVPPAMASAAVLMLGLVNVLEFSEAYWKSSASGEADDTDGISCLLSPAPALPTLADLSVL